MSQYEKILNYIFKAFPMYHRVGSSAYKEGLENIEALATITNNPENNFPIIHIAGTNGKGSVAHLLASYCQELGLKTGLFTSPHLIDFRERIKINGKEISEENVIHFFEHYDAELKQIQPSFFELTTILAFDYFAKQKVDVAIIEVGLGGRLDATNIVHPFLSIITNISLEHTQMLGDTCAKIAFEKGGIIKPNTPVVIGEYNEETLPVFEQIASKNSTKLTLTDTIEIKLLQENLSNFLLNIYKDKQLWIENAKFPLPGLYELKNLKTFLASVPFINQYFQLSTFPIRPAIEHVIHNTHLLGRWQIISDKPLIICDVGHNPEGLRNTMQQLSQMKCRKIHFLIGFVNDKDIDSILPLLPQNASYYLCQADIERALAPMALEPLFKAKGVDYVVGSSVAATFALIQFNAQNDDIIYIGGSCFVVGDFLKAIKEKKIHLN